MFEIQLPQFRYTILFERDSSAASDTASAWKSSSLEECTQLSHNKNTYIKLLNAIVRVLSEFQSEDLTSGDDDTLYFFEVLFYIKKLGLLRKCDGVANGSSRTLIRPNH